jgi:hypothetical protein
MMSELGRVPGKLPPVAENLFDAPERYRAVSWKEEVSRRKCDRYDTEIYILRSRHRSQTSQLDKYRFGDRRARPGRGFLCAVTRGGWGRRG